MHLPSNIFERSIFPKKKGYSPCVNFINILRALFCQYPFAKKSQSQTVFGEKLRKAFSYEKRASKRLVKLPYTFCSIQIVFLKSQVPDIA